MFLWTYIPTKLITAITQRTLPYRYPLIGILFNLAKQQRSPIESILSWFDRTKLFASIVIMRRQLHMPAIDVCFNDNLYALPMVLKTVFSLQFIKWCCIYICFMLATETVPTLPGMSASVFAVVVIAVVLVVVSALPQQTKMQSTNFGAFQKI